MLSITFTSFGPFRPAQSQDPAHHLDRNQMGSPHSVPEIPYPQRRASDEITQDTMEAGLQRDELTISLHAYHLAIHLRRALNW